MILQLVKRVFDVSNILMHDTLQTTSPFTDAVINEVREILKFVKIREFNFLIHKILILDLWPQLLNIQYIVT